MRNICIHEYGHTLQQLRDREDALIFVTLREGVWSVYSDNYRSEGAFGAANTAAGCILEHIVAGRPGGLIDFTQVGVLDEKEYETFDEDEQKLGWAIAHRDLLLDSMMPEFEDDLKEFAHLLDNSIGFIWSNDKIHRQVISAEALKTMFGNES